MTPVTWIVENFSEGEDIFELIQCIKDSGHKLTLIGRKNGFETVESNIVDTSRWSIINDIVIKRKSDGKFFRDEYSVGATESQEESPYEYSEPNFSEVFPVETKVIVYK